MNSGPLIWLTIAALGWLILIAALHFVLAPWLRSRIGHSATLGLLWCIARGFSRLLHRVRFRGREHVPSQSEAGPLIVVSNHTGSIDPFLIQAGCPFFIRWMMGADMMGQALSDLWQLMEVIPVDRTGRDLASAREAIRHVRSGGIVGIFPEGRIVTPPERVWPFFEGVGLIVSRTKAPVLLVWISDTPATTDMKRSLLTPSRSCVTFVDLLEFSDDHDPTHITATLRSKLAEISGWPQEDPRSAMASSAVAQRDDGEEVEGLSAGARSESVD